MSNQDYTETLRQLSNIKMRDRMYKHIQSARDGLAYNAVKVARHYALMLSK